MTGSVVLGIYLVNITARMVACYSLAQALLVLGFPVAPDVATCCGSTEVRPAGLKAAPPNNPGHS